MEFFKNSSTWRQLWERRRRGSQPARAGLRKWDAQVLDWRELNLPIPEASRHCFAGAWGQGGTVGRRALNGICATAPDAHATAPPGPPAGLHRPEKTHPTYFFRVQGQYHSPNSCSICRLRQDDAGTPPGFSVDVPTSPRTCTATATCVVVLWRVLLPSIVTPTGHARLAGGV
jgi:hypothetical protein